MAIATQLNITEILDSALTAFLRAPLPLRGFSITSRKNQRPLQRGDTMRVPYYPLVANESEDFTAAGYNFTNGVPAVNFRDVKVDKRKYQPIVTTSEELSRFNYSPAEIGRLKGNKLAIDMNADILSVVTAANFDATAAFTGLPAAFDSDAVIDVRNACKKANWPSDQEWILALDTDYHTALEKDGEIKPAYSYGNTNPIQEGMFGRLAGFNVMESNEIPANGENLVGFAATQSAILIGNAPIPPGGGRDDVANRTVEYAVATDPATGVSLEYRKWFDADLDQVREVIEVNYGYAFGEAEAIKRIVSA